MKRKVLTEDFFARGTRTVAKELLGKYLVRRYRGKEIALMITETEAYDGHNDKASHAHRGKTPRNHVMFGPPGVCYVYFTYGMHWMLNLTTGKEGYPAAVLIRGAGAYDGPAKLTKALHIDKKLNAKKAEPESALWIEDRGEKVPESRIRRTPRIGIDRAQEWKDKPYRYVLKK